MEKISFTEQNYEKPFIVQHIGKIIWVIFGIGVVLGGTVLALYFYKFNVSLSTDHSIWAQFGDYLGGVLGSAFAFLALIALLFTLRLQSYELRVSSEELKNSAAALEKQSKSLSMQNFENRFFNMLSLHHQIVDGMDLRKGGTVTASGRDCLRVFYSRLSSRLDQATKVIKKPEDNLKNYREIVRDSYESFYRDVSHELGHYFRYIYRILKFIHESQIDNKSEYSGILRAQLSNPELALLFYNGVTWRGSKFKPLAEDYALFENLELKLLVNQTVDTKLYKISAFGDQADKIQ